MRDALKGERCTSVHDFNPHKCIGLRCAYTIGHEGLCCPQFGWEPMSEGEYLALTGQAA